MKVIATKILLLSFLLLTISTIGCLQEKGGEVLYTTTGPSAIASQPARLPFFIR
ncbi:MAG: hypothetical protein WCO84_02400 [bacterium]